MSEKIIFCWSIYLNLSGRALQEFLSFMVFLHVFPISLFFLPNALENDKV